MRSRIAHRSAHPRPTYRRALSPLRLSLAATLRLAPALAAALVLALVAGGCEDHRVPENVPSGDGPARMPEVETSVAEAQRPPAPIVEPALAGPAEREPGGEAASQPAARPAGGGGHGAHLTLTGDYNLDADAAVSCALYPTKGLTLDFALPGAPQVAVRAGGLFGAGRATAEILVRGETRGVLRLSRGAGELDLEVTPTSQPRYGSLLSGRFTGAFDGAAGKGRIAGRFEGCFFGSGPTP